MPDLQQMLREAVETDATTFAAADIRRRVRLRQRRRRAGGIASLAMAAVVLAVGVGVVSSRPSDTPVVLDDSLPAETVERPDPVPTPGATVDPFSYLGVQLQVTVHAAGETAPGLSAEDGRAVTVGDGVGVLLGAPEVDVPMAVRLRCDGRDVEVREDAGPRESRLPEVALVRGAAQAVARLPGGCVGLLGDGTATFDLSEPTGHLWIDPLLDRMAMAEATPCCAGAGPLSVTREAVGWGLETPEGEIAFVAIDATTGPAIDPLTAPAVSCDGVILLPTGPDVATDTQRLAEILGCAPVIGGEAIPGAALIAALEDAGYAVSVLAPSDGVLPTAFGYAPRRAPEIPEDPPGLITVEVDGPETPEPEIRGDTPLVALADGEAAVLDDGRLRFRCADAVVTTTGPSDRGAQLPWIAELPEAAGCQPLPPGVTGTETFTSIREARLRAALAAIGVDEVSGEPSHGGSDASYVYSWEGRETIMFAGPDRTQGLEWQGGPTTPLGAGEAYLLGVDDGLPGLAFVCGDTYVELSRDHTDADAHRRAALALADALACVPRI